MWDFKLLDATRALEKTMAYMIYRLAMYLVLSLILVFSILAGSGIGLILDSLFDSAGFFASIGGVVGFAVFSFVLYSFRGAWLHSIKAPHIVLLNESVNESVVQHGWAQVGHARKQVSERFSTAKELFTLDKRVRSVLAFLFGYCTDWGKQFSNDNDTPFARFLGSLVLMPVTYTHEVVLARCLKDTSRSASAVAAEALEHTAENYDRLCKNALVLLIMKYVGALCIFLLMLSPVAWIDGLIPVEFGNWTYVFALLLTWPLKSALFDPIVLAALVAVDAQLDQGRKQETDWESILTAKSEEYAKLRKQAEFIDSSQPIADAGAEQAPETAGE